MKRLSPIWKVVFLCILLGVLVSMHVTVTRYRVDVSNLQSELARRLVTTRTQSEIISELNTHRLAIEQFEQYTVSSTDTMLALVELIETQGQLENVSVEIPNIEELIPQTEQETREQISDARIVIVGRGEPRSLLAFLHRVEHVPYALVLEAWNLTASVRTEYTGTDGQAVDVSEIVIEMRIPIRSSASHEIS